MKLTKMEVAVLEYLAMMTNGVKEVIEKDVTNKKEKQMHLKWNKVVFENLLQILARHEEESK